MEAGERKQNPRRVCIATRPPTLIPIHHCRDTTSRGKLIQISAQLRRQEFAFLFCTFRRSQRAILNLWSFFFSNWFPESDPFSFSKTCKWPSGERRNFKKNKKLSRRRDDCRLIPLLHIMTKIKMGSWRHDSVGGGVKTNSRI